MKTINIKSYLMISLLIFSASGIIQNNVSGDSSDNSQCTTTFPKGAIDLGSNVQYAAKVYPPGVYCINGAANIGSGPITLSGDGVHMFKISGALKQAANTSVILADGAKASDVTWVPTGATTIGANSHLIGTVNGAPITIGANSDINGIKSSKMMADAISGNFGILSSTYTNTAAGTILSGDLGYTTGPKVVPSVSGSTHVADAAYSQAGIAQNAMTNLANSQVCTDNLGSKVDLSLVNDGVYAPGVYCTTNAVSIGTGGITLSGEGVYIFKIRGALTTVANSSVTLTNGARASDVTWVPTSATTLGANSNFAGTILDAAGVTIGGNTIVVGKVLAFGGTVTTGPSVTITIPAQSMADAASSSAQCTVTFPKGAIDLGSNVQFAAKVYPPGIYCINGAANIGSGPITLSGDGVHMFRIHGALKQAVNTSVILADGAQASDVTWVPTGATTIGANSHMIGTVNGAPITIGANSDINGINPAKIMADAISGNFGILASTYTNTATGTVLTGDLGYTTGPKVVPSVSGSTHVADATYSQAGIAQNAMTALLNSQACTDNLGTTVNLSMVNSGIYTPGVYCTTGAASIGPRGITLSGNGVHIFKIDGALTTVAKTSVTLANGAKISDISWVPTGATTLGANSNFAGTILDAAGVTIGKGTHISGRVMAFGGTVTTGPSVTITVPARSMADAVSGNAQCTFTFPKGAIDLGSNVQFAAKVYPPGIYCINGAANIGSGPITMSGEGAHMFKINGALKQAVNTSVILANGARASDVTWMPTGATTIGANSHLIGTVNGVPITIGANSDINGINPAKIMADAIPGNFGILASTYTNTATGTVLTGDLGYTTGPKVVPSVSGSTHVADATYSQAGIAQKVMTSLSNSQACTSNLGTTVDLSLVHGGVYTSGVYCTTGAASIGTNGITLSGNGAHIFKIDGALTTVANSNVRLSNGAQASDISWVPTSATTLGANSNFAGTILDASGVTIGNGVTISGRVMAFGGTVSTGPSVTITVPAQAMADAISGNFGILSSTYTNTAAGTVLTGDLGYTTGPKVVPSVSGSTHVGDSSYSQAGIEQKAMTSLSNSQACTDNLGTKVDLSLVNGGVYTPGVYCTTGAASIGSGGITLSGNGVHIFKINGALTTVANSNVRLDDGAQASDIFWVPTSATTLGANSNFAGTILDASGVTIGGNTSISGRVLAFGGTVSTGPSVTITAQ